MILQKKPRFLKPEPLQIINSCDYRFLDNPWSEYQEIQAENDEDDESIKPFSSNDEYENNNDDDDKLNEDGDKIPSLIFQRQFDAEDSNDEDDE